MGLIKSKLNSQYIGIISGLAMPILTLFLFWQYNINRFPTIKSIFQDLQLEGAYIKLLSLCIIPNLLIFFIFIHYKKDISAKGVLLATMLYTFAIIILKFT